MSSLTYGIYSTAPAGYETPPFPGLYWPIPVDGPQRLYLYHALDIWRFTLLWTILFFGAVHLATSIYTCLVQWRNWKLIWTVPAAYLLISAMEAVVAGSVVGGLLGGVYNAGYYKMSTWIPFVWGAINTLVLILSSFAIQGGL